MDFEELINFVVVVIFIGVALLVKFIEAASKKKRPLPMPVPEAPEVPEEVWPELEIEPEPEPEIEVKEPVKVPRRPEKKPEIITPKEEVPTPPSRFLSRKDLQEGIILSTILGPPRSRSRWFAHGR